MLKPYLFVLTALVWALPVTADEPLPVIPADAELEIVAEGFGYTEGPALAPDGSIYFSDIPNNSIYRYDPETGETKLFTDGSGGANGLMFDGVHLWACAGGAREVRVYPGARDQTFRHDEATGELVEESTHWRGLSPQPSETLSFGFFEGKRLNSPNDIAMAFTRPAIYFTDPRYGNRDDLEQPSEAVYVFLADATGKAPELRFRLIDHLVRPNGIALSPDERTLYVNDNAAKKVMAYDLVNPGEVANGRVLHDLDDLGGPDGMCVDSSGRLYVAVYDGWLVVISPEGERLGVLKTGSRTSNCTFGADGETLYLTSEAKLKRIRLNTGAP